MVWPTWFTVFPPCRGHFLLSTENVLYKVDEAVCTCCKITGTKGNARELDHSAIEVLDFDHYALDNPLFRITSWPTYVLWITLSVFHTPNVTSTIVTYPSFLWPSSDLLSYLAVPASKHPPFSIDQSTAWLSGLHVACRLKVIMWMACDVASVRPGQMWMWDTWNGGDGTCMGVSVCTSWYRIMYPGGLGWDKWGGTVICRWGRKNKWVWADTVWVDGTIGWV